MNNMGNMNINNNMNQNNNNISNMHKIYLQEKKFSKPPFNRLS